MISVYPFHVTDDALREMLAQWSHLLDRAQPFCLISDTRPMVETLTPLQRKIIVEFYEREPRLEKYLVGLASIMTLPENRGAAQAIGWVKPPPFPRHEFGSMAEARAWALQRLREHAPR